MNTTIHNVDLAEVLGYETVEEIKKEVLLIQNYKQKIGESNHLQCLEKIERLFGRKVTKYDQQEYENKTTNNKDSMYLFWILRNFFPRELVSKEIMYNNRWIQCRNDNNEIMYIYLPL